MLGVDYWRNLLHPLLVLFNLSRKAVLLGYVLGDTVTGAWPSVQNDLEEICSKCKTNKNTIDV